ncbi:MAG: Small archaeal modifier protein 1 [Methanosaeta sp. PtaU1.Bin016]|nr:MAG: Small archaeal modifier protein 1 [Methanosaeta sp. PtaU1.Bin016]
MLVKVRAFASIREILGRELELDLRAGSTLRELLEGLASTNRRFKEAAFEESGQLRDWVQIMINRKMIDPLQALEAELHEGDEIAIFPPVAGG